MEESKRLRKIISDKLLSDSIKGSQDILGLPLNLAIALLKIHNKRCVQFLLEFDYRFELYISDFHREFLKISNCIKSCNEHHIPNDLLRTIEHNMIYSPNSIFLHGQDLVLHSEIQAILGLHEAGFLNFNPCESEELSKHFKLNEDNKIVLREESDFYARDFIGKLSVLINTPNAVNLDENVGSRHFKPESFHFYLYTSAISRANLNAKSLKQMNDVFSSKIIMDMAIKNIQGKIQKALSGCELAINEFSVLLKQIQVDSSMMNKKFKKNCLVLSDLNQILGFILKAPNLNKMKRGEVLEFLFDKKNDVNKIGNYLIKYELVDIIK